MDKALASGAGDCGFESHRGRLFDTAFFGFLHRRLSVCCLCERDCLRQLDLMNMLASSQQSIFLVVVGWQIESSA
jgi:hypothetical protein